MLYRSNFFKYDDIFDYLDLRQSLGITGSKIWPPATLPTWPPQLVRHIQKNQEVPLTLYGENV